MKTWEWILIIFLACLGLAFLNKYKPHLVYINLVPVEKNFPMDQSNIWDKKL